MRLTATTVGAMAAAMALPAGVGAAPAAHGRAAACAAAKNVEAIIDDSGSMRVTDPGRLRVAGLELLIDTPANGKLRLGAVEFGGQFSFASSPPSADTVFAPNFVGGREAAMRAALEAVVKADNGLTDYNAAFKKATADNPTAGARIFLTDGGHDVDAYANGHRGGPPTYVIAFGSALTGTNAARLRQIASETGGTLYRVANAGDLQPVFNDVSLKLSCSGVARRFADAFRRPGVSPVHRLSLGASARSVQLALTWSSPRDAFDISGARIVRGRRVVAAARRIKVTRRRGKTFVVVGLSNVTRGTLQFRLRALHVGSGGRVRLTTQVSQSRRR